MNLVAGVVSWYAVTVQDAIELNPFTTFTPFGFFARILAILTAASMLLRNSEARRNIAMGMILGAVSADAIWDLIMLNPLPFAYNVFSYTLDYFIFAAVIGTATMVPTFVALVEVSRLKRQLNRYDSAS